MPLSKSSLKFQFFIRKKGGRNIHVMQKGFFFFEQKSQSFYFFTYDGKKEAIAL